MYDHRRASILPVGSPPRLSTCAWIQSPIASMQVLTALTMSSWAMLACCFWSALRRCTSVHTSAMIAWCCAAVGLGPGPMASMPLRPRCSACSHSRVPGPPPRSRRVPPPPPPPPPPRVLALRLPVARVPLLRVRPVPRGPAPPQLSSFTSSAFTRVSRCDPRGSMAPSSSAFRPPVAAFSPAAASLSVSPSSSSCATATQLSMPWRYTPSSSMASSCSVQSHALAHLGTVACIAGVMANSAAGSSSSSTLSARRRMRSTNWRTSCALTGTP
mmetsp:Transcript_17731/g.53362  ORF Transcript_17731/g.53362 Transcript_17731/m.53362 type:complete len:272 (+) Transcript_17731:1775-2590(+)